MCQSTGSSVCCLSLCMGMFVFLWYQVRIPAKIHVLGKNLKKGGGRQYIGRGLRPLCQLSNKMDSAWKHQAIEFLMFWCLKFFWYSCLSASGFYAFGYGVSCIRGSHMTNTAPSPLLATSFTRHRHRGLFKYVITF